MIHLLLTVIGPHFRAVKFASFFYAFVFIACGSSPPASTVEKPAVSDAAAEIDGGLDDEGKSLLSATWMPVNDERTKLFLKARGDGLVLKHVPNLNTEIAAKLEKALRNRDLAIFSFLSLLLQYARNERKPIVEQARAIPQKTISELEKLAGASTGELGPSADLLSAKARAQELMYAGRLILARVSERKMSIEEGRKLIQALLVEVKAIDLTYEALERAYGVERLPRILASVDAESFWYALRSVEYYAVLMASDNPCLEMYFSNPLLGYIWDSLGPERRGSLCQEGRGHGPPKYNIEVSASELSGLERSECSKLKVQIPELKRTPRASYPFGKWDDRVVVFFSTPKQKIIYSEFDQKTSRLTPIKIAGGNQIEGLAENDEELFALVREEDGLSLARRLKEGGEWTFEPLPNCGSDGNPCRIVAGGSRIFALDRNQILFLSPEGTWVSIPITSFFGDQDVRGRVSAALIQGNDLFIGFDHGEFGGGLVRLPLAENPRRPIGSGEYLRQMIVGDIVPAADGTIWIVGALSNLRDVSLFRYRDSKLETVLFQSCVPAIGERPERCFRVELEAKRVSRIPGTLTHLAQSDDGGIYLLFPKLGIARFKDDRLELVIETVLEVSKEFKSETADASVRYSTYPDDLFVLPSGDFLVGTQVGLLLLKKSGGKWISRWIQAPKGKNR